MNLKDFFSKHFEEIFAGFAFIVLIAYIWYCTATGNKTDSVRDAWNVIILIAGYAWGKSAQKKPDKEEGEQ